MHHHEPECHAEKLVCYFQGQGHSKGSKCQCLSRWYLLAQQTFCFQTWYCDASSWVWVSCKKTDLLFWRSRSLQELIWSNVIISTVFFELLILLLPNLVWKYIIISQSVLWRNWIVAFKVKVTAKFQNVMTSSELLNLLVPNLVWWCICDGVEW